MLLFTDWTLLRLFPPLRAMWAAIGTQAKVAITGQNAKRVLFGTINVRTARRTIYIGRNAGAPEVQAFLLALRKAYRRAGTIWLLADRASGHTAKATLALAEALRIEFVWLPRQWPELNAMDQLWKERKRPVRDVWRGVGELPKLCVAGASFCSSRRSRGWAWQVETPRGFSAELARR